MVTKVKRRRWMMMKICKSLAEGKKTRRARSDQNENHVNFWCESIFFFFLASFLQHQDSKRYSFATCNRHAICIYCFVVVVVVIVLFTCSLTAAGETLDLIALKLLFFR